MRSLSATARASLRRFHGRASISGSTLTSTSTQTWQRGAWLVQRRCVLLATMHFALPPRKTSHPPPYAARQVRSSPTRSRRLQLTALIGCGVLAILFFLSRILFSPSTSSPPGTAEVVIVTPLDHALYASDFLAKIQRNRRDYAKLHGVYCGVG